MATDEPYPPGPPGTPPGPSDKYFEGLTFCLGLASLFCCGLLAGIPAIYVGAQALSDIEASHGRLRGRGLAWVGIILGVLGTIGSVGGGVTWYQMHNS